MAFTAAAAEKEATATKAPDEMIVTIVDASTGKAISNATVIVQADDRDKPIPPSPPNSCRAVPRHNLACDSSGRSVVPLAKLRLEFVRIIATAEGYAKRQVQWSGEDNARRLPGHYVLKLQRAITIGGMVTDTNGKPLSGATVSAERTLDYEELGPIQDYSLLSATTTTDKSGHWSIDSAPPDAKHIIVSANLEGFIEERLYDHEKELKEGHAIMQLKRGVALHGRVVDDGGHPLGAAEVMWEPEGRNSISATTDADGTFTIATADPEGGDVVVRAKGKAPILRHISPKSGEDVKFVLTKAHVFSGTVVDSAGHLIEGASVRVTQWAGRRWSGLIRAETDAQGKFSFDGPSEPLMVEVYKSGFLQDRGKGIAPQDESYRMVLRHPLKVAGSVTDAETGKPIDHFKVIEGWGSDEHIGWVGSREAKEGFDGRYEVNFTFDRGWGQPFRLRIDADGYAPASSPAIDNSAKDDGKTITFDAKMHRAAAITGIVVDLAGKPIIGADVVLATPDSQTSITNGRIDEQNFSLKTQTGHDGHFQFPPQSVSFTVLVLADSGFGEVSGEQFSKDSKIVIAPWGRIEGKMMIGSKPASGATAVIWEPWFPSRQQASKPNINITWEAVADPDGRFVIDRVTPGMHQIGRRLDLADRSWMIQVRQKLPVTSGQTAIVQLGGSGRAVVGRFHVPENLPTPWKFEFTQLGEPIPPVPQPKLPDNWKSMSSKQQETWINAWNQSPEQRAIWKKIQAARQRNEPYNFVVNSDNSFRIDDVKPGRYQITGFIEPAIEPGLPGWGKRLGEMDTVVTIGPGTAEQDLGTIEVKPVTP